MNWFFDQWLNSNKTIDYRVKRVKQDKDGYSEIILARKTTMQMPIDVEVTYTDGTTESHHIPNTYFVKNTTAFVKKNIIDGFTTYPNPITAKIFTISSNNSDTKQVTIFNVLGKKVFSTHFSGTTKSIDVSAINAGVYILKVLENDKSATKKIIIK
mgnify:CR=1 FL=1